MAGSDIFPFSNYPLHRKELLISVKTEVSLTLETSTQSITVTLKLSTFTSISASVFVKFPGWKNLDLKCCSLVTSN